MARSIQNLVARSVVFSLALALVSPAFAGGLGSLASHFGGGGHGGGSHLGNLLGGSHSNHSKLGDLGKKAGNKSSGLGKNASHKGGLGDAMKGKKNGGGANKLPKKDGGKKGPINKDTGNKKVGKKGSDKGTNKKDGKTGTGKKDTGNKKKTDPGNAKKDKKDTNKKNKDDKQTKKHHPKGKKGHHHHDDFDFVDLFPTDVFSGTGDYEDVVVSDVTPVAAYAPVDVADEVADEEVAATADIELVDVQLVRAGAGKRGPVYRVVVRNNSDAAIDESFDVGLIATNGEAPSPKAPFAVGRVESLEAGETTAINIRLPYQVNAMSKNAAGQAVPFRTLFAAADIRQEIEESDKDNNSVQVARGAITPASDEEVAVND